MTREDWNPRPGPRPDGGLAVASILLLLTGSWKVLIGYSIATGEAAAFAGDGYWHRADGPGWGWLNLLLGAAAIVLAAVLAVSGRGDRRRRAATVLACGVAAVSAIGQFFLAPQYPLWSTLAIAAEILVVWALSIRIGAGPETADPDRIHRLGPRTARRLAR